MQCSASLRDRGWGLCASAPFVWCYERDRGWGRNFAPSRGAIQTWPYSAPPWSAVGPRSYRTALGGVLVLSGLPTLQSTCPSGFTLMSSRPCQRTAHELSSKAE